MLLLWGGLALLVTAAFCLPLLVFYVQDGRKMGTVERGERENLYTKGLNADYGKSMQERLYNFAKGLAAGRKYQVMETAFPEEYGSEEELWTRILYGDTGGLIHEIPGWFYTWPNFYESILNADLDSGTGNRLISWKRYLVYDDETVFFVLWYIEFSEPEGENVVQLVMDEESGTVYYMQGIFLGDPSNPNPRADRRTKKGRHSVGELFTYYEELLELRERFRDYYEAERPSEGPVDLTNDAYTCFLQYGENELMIELYYEAAAKQYPDDRRPEIRAGIPAVGALIPEMDNRNLPKYEGGQEDEVE